MDCYRLSVALLLVRPDAPQLGEVEASELQDAQMSYLADLHQARYLLAAGPLTDDSFRGLTILKGDTELARPLMEKDPAVRAGRLKVTVMPWMVPRGAMEFSTARFPRSMAEVDE
jgi:uncharacterized protein YciI